MAHKNPLGKIKDVAVTGLKDPVGTATGAASLGRLIAGEVTRKAAGGVTSLVNRRKPSAAPAAVDPTATQEPVARRADEPIHAPATKADQAGSDEPHVEATPADLAKVVAKQPATARKAAATKSPAAAAAKKSAPGAKLPPRKPAPEITTE